MSDHPFLPNLILLSVLVLVNAFFAAAEIAVLSLSEARLLRQAKAGEKKAARLLALTRSPDRFLSAIQIAITLAGFLSSAFAADSFSDPLVSWLVEEKGVAAPDPRVLNNITVVLITVVLSYFSLVLGELVPKRIAMQKTEAVARFVLGPVCAVAAVCRPVIWLLSKSTDGVLRLLRVDPRTGGQSVTADDIRALAELGAEQGSIQPWQRELIERALDGDERSHGKNGSAVG